MKKPPSGGNLGNPPTGILLLKIVEKARFCMVTIILPVEIPSYRSILALEVKVAVMVALMEISKLSMSIIVSPI